MKSLLLIVMTCLLTACVTTTQVAPEVPAQCEATQAIQSPQWYNSGHIYRLRHNGVIEINGRTLHTTGFMVLDTKKHQAKVALMTGLGIKFATLDVTKDTVTVINASPVAKIIPHFIEQCASTIQRIFLTDFPKINDVCSKRNAMYILTGQREQGSIQTSIDQTNGVVTGKSRNTNGENWSVVFDGTMNVDGILLPKKIVFNDTKHNYTVTLQLNDAEIQ